MLTPAMYHHMDVHQRRVHPDSPPSHPPPLSPLLHDVRHSPKNLGHPTLGHPTLGHPSLAIVQHPVQQAFEQRGRREDFFRVRTASLGSAASSSRSPGRDSVNSQDSSCGGGGGGGLAALVSSSSSSSSSSGSPSPSPPCPAQEGSSSTLFNILKGNLTSPYARLFRNSPSPVVNPRCRCGCSRAGRLTPPSAAAVKRSHSECVLPGQQHQDEPIDLSCKRSRTQSTPAPGAGDSILESILCGRVHSEWAPALGGRPPSVSSMAPPASPAGSESSVASSLGGTGGSRVSLAKKNMFPVCARVTDWLSKMAAFCRTHAAFVRLSPDDQLGLLLGAWPRLLLLDMAETHFEFAVSGSSSMSADDEAAYPTMHDVEKVQGFIRRCQALAADPEEFRLLRTATLFQRSTGLVHQGSGQSTATLVEDASATVRQALHDHVTATRPDEKMRYSALLLCLHALCGVNARALQSLFCSHLTQPMPVLLRRLLDEEPSH
ncbi:hypothetical protein CAPTEDRAFT_218808 [Capitella teleta]|uniref:NR LBD domain-containing protein n=1 Tax=Capitella teleta TaxID=283909 RepID=R7UEG5_CAPTE|nr:hypothetical protein CAPTEDRAFT_218808 [Capitella teleta]|eukprot:ELU02183.1 hypothetical protein CAPTEDRAFT_218808 [Capitella teleta]